MGGLEIETVAQTDRLRLRERDPDFYRSILCASASRYSSEPRPSFIPGGRAPRREQSPAAMIPFTKTHGLYVGDEIDGECQPVFLTTGRALDR